MILSIPIKSIPNQRITTVLNKQNVTIDIVTRGVDLFATVYLGATQIITQAKCNNSVYLNQYATTLNGYLYFKTENGLEFNYLELGKNAILYYADYDVLGVYND
jgi:hypothetical protein